MTRLGAVLLLILCLGTIWLPPAAAAPARLAAQAPAGPGAPTATPAPPPDRSAAVKAILDRMSVADKVGQLFLVTFQGHDVSPESDIAALVRDYRVGGVVLLPANDNFRNILTTETAVSASLPVTPTGLITATQPGPASTPQQIAALANALQTLVTAPPRPIAQSGAVTQTGTLAVAPTDTISLTTGITPTTPLTTTAPVTRMLAPELAATATAVAAAAAGPPESPGLAVPLLIALDWPGDDSSFFSGTGGFTPLPSAMSMGATWSPKLAEQTGQVVGQELRATGANLLLGPTLDVLDVPRPGSKGDLNTRTFGGDPFWVGQLGQAFIRGVQAGSAGAVLTAAKHFPGQGASDRRPEDEFATVQKSVQQLRQIELAPFAAVTSSGDLHAPGTTAALVTSHIRYRGLQGNIRVTTPPISLAPQLQDLMALKEFADWRAAGGVLISEALGVPALRRYYDPTLTKFPHRQVAQDAFLAGNDLLYLGRFALTDDWPDQMAAIKETLLFFQDKYRTDAAFRARVDASVERILHLKLDIYGDNWQPEAFQRDAAATTDQVGQSAAVTQAVARAGLTLIYPGREEFADRMPSAPLADENILIITDARAVRECPACPPAALIPPQAIEEIILRLYGPNATGQVAPKQISSLTFADLNRMLAAKPGQERAVEDAIAGARWIVFAQLDYNPEEYPESGALRAFLAQRSDSLRDKRLVVLAFSAPYYLDTTEISKLTAYFGVYSRTAPFLETAVRALFREFSPVGAPSVSVSGINYDLIRQLEPLPGQIIALSPVEPAEQLSGSIKVGSQIVLETSIISDRNGNPVPDGTPVDFRLRYPTESLALAPKTETTSGGKARTTVVLDRPGELWITAEAGEARDSTRIELKVGGDTPGSIATVVPTPTLLPTVTMTPTPAPTATDVPTPAPTLTPVPGAGAADKPPQPRVPILAFFFGVIGAVLAGGAAFAVRRRSEHAGIPNTSLMPALEAALWAVVAAWIAYLLYAVGWLPGATAVQTQNYTWAAGLVTFIAGTGSLLWTARRRI